MATEQKIGSEVFRCEKLPADAAIKLYLKVNETFAGNTTILATIAAGHNRDNAIRAFVQTTATVDLDADKVSALMVEAVSLCRVGNDPCIVGVKPQTMEDTLEVAWFALGVQFRDFLHAGLPKG